MTPSERLWEVDLARTLAIGMMVAYHAAFDVDLLAPREPLDILSGRWHALQVVTASLFLALVGVSLAISDGRSRARGRPPGAAYLRHVRRAAQVAVAAAAVSVATYATLGNEYVRFGILHCIAVAMVICPLLLPLGRWNLPLAALALGAGHVLAGSGPSDLPGLLALGVPTPANVSVDWYPLLPWLAPVLVGLAVGRALYPDGRRGPWGARLGRPRAAVALGWPGRHSLPFYLTHQFVLLPLVAVLILAGSR